MATAAGSGSPSSKNGPIASWRDVDLAGSRFRVRQGKTAAARRWVPVPEWLARLLVETAVERPSTYLICRSTYCELEDSTKKVLLHGDGSVPPAIPPELVAQYRASDNVVRLKTGSEILFRSLEEQNVGKLLNITAGAFLIDQAEELDEGEAIGWPSESRRSPARSRTTSCSGSRTTVRSRSYSPTHGGPTDRGALERALS